MSDEIFEFIPNTEIGPRIQVHNGLLLYEIEAARQIPVSSVEAVVLDFGRTVAGHRYQQINAPRLEIDLQGNIQRPGGDRRVVSLGSLYTHRVVPESLVGGAIDPFCNRYDRVLRRSLNNVPEALQTLTALSEDLPFFMFDQFNLDPLHIQPQQICELLAKIHLAYAKENGFPDGVIQLQQDRQCSVQSHPGLVILPLANEYVLAIDISTYQPPKELTGAVNDLLALQQ